jgi:hypothetical protein
VRDAVRRLAQNIAMARAENFADYVFHSYGHFPILCQSQGDKGLQYFQSSALEVLANEVVNNL